MKFFVSRLLFAFAIISIGCQTEPSTSGEGDLFQVIIRLPSEPDNLNPMLSKSAYASSIENLILYPLAEFDPFDMVLQPLIIDEVPVPKEITEGKFKGSSRYDFNIRKEAQWSDGEPITGYDYAFTVKTACNPGVNSPFWRRNMEAIQDIQISSANPQNFSIITNEDNGLLGVLALVNFNIFPKHFYDPTGRMDEYSISTMLNEEKVDSLFEVDVNLQAFGTEFLDVKFTREIVEGAGPYAFEEWATGEYISVKKKENWWGNKVADAPRMFTANPDHIEYRIIPDENTALTALKDGGLDLIAEVSADQYVQLRDDPNMQNKLDFETPSIMMYNYLELNNRSPKLADVNVRKALAYTLDIDAIIKNLSQGLSQRTVGPVHPSKEYYNNKLKPIAKDLEKAKTLLSAAGWSDTNQDGTVDKILEGKRVELDLDILVTQKKEGQQIALILKENAAKVGININIETLEGAALLSSVRKRDFEIVPMRKRSNPYVYDPSQSWHSESDRPGGGNATGYRDQEADKLIDQIMASEGVEQQTALFKELQEVLYEDQPVIFLYVPLEKVIVSKKLKIQPSSRRPGYFENLFEKAA